MKKKITKKKVEEVIPVVEKSQSCTDCKCKEISKLTGISGNEDFNKLVEKINEIIENKCH